MGASVKTLDFSNVKDRGNFNPKHKPEGGYKAKIVKVEDSTSKAGNAQWLYTFELVGDKRATYPYYCGHDAEQAWKIRNVLIAAGFNVPKKKAKVDPNKPVGKIVGIELEDDEYEGKMKSVISAVIPLSDLDEVDDDTDEADEDDEEVEEDDEDESDDDDSDDDSDDDEDDEDEDEDEDEEDEEPEPPKKKSKSKKAKPEPVKKGKKGKAKAKKADDDDDDLEELDIEDI